MPNMISAAALAGVLCAVLAAHAQPYPAKAIRVIAGFPPGSGADITARVIGAKLNDALGQQFANQGIETLGGTPEQFASYIREEIAKWAKVIKLSGASAN